MAKKAQKTSTETREEPKTQERAMDGSQAKAIIEEHGGISKAMRALAAEGHKYGAISKILNKRYQHVRNVLITPVGKKNDD